MISEKCASKSKNAGGTAGQRPRVIVAQIGARHNYAIASALERHGCLSALYTDFCLFDWRAHLADVFPDVDSMWMGKLRRRTVRGVPTERIRSSWVVNVLPHLNRLQGHFAYRYQERLFGRIMQRWGLRDANIVYAMFGSGGSFLDMASLLGVKIVVDMFGNPMFHRIMIEESACYPDWAETWSIAHEELAEIENEVHRCIALADVLLCPSQTVVDGVAAYGERAVEKTLIMPYANTAQYRTSPRPEPGRVLFAGSATLMKGIHYLAGAANRLKAVPGPYEFVIAGGVSDQVRGHPEARNLRFLGHLSRKQMDVEFLRADVFVLPSLSEGSASVVYEALAAGVPVVTTYSSGSVVTDGVEGFIVPERDIVAVVDAIQRIVEDRELRARMSVAALATASDHTVERWAERLVETLGRMV